MFFFMISANEEFIYKNWIYFGRWKSLHGDLKTSEKNKIGQINYFHMLTIVLIIENIFSFKRYFFPRIVISSEKIILGSKFYLNK